jgi:hypothetical protein
LIPQGCTLGPGCSARRGLLWSMRGGATPPTGIMVHIRSWRQRCAGGPGHRCHLSVHCLLPAVGWLRRGTLWREPACKNCRCTGALCHRKTTPSCPVMIMMEITDTSNDSPADQPACLQCRHLHPLRPLQSGATAIQALIADQGTVPTAPTATQTRSPQEASAPLDLPAHMPLQPSPAPQPACTTDSLHHRQPASQPACTCSVAATLGTTTSACPAPVGSERPTHRMHRHQCTFT